MSEDKSNDFSDSINNAKLSIGKIIEKIFEDSKTRLSRLDDDLDIGGIKPQIDLKYNLPKLKKRSIDDDKETAEEDFGSRAKK